MKEQIKEKIIPPIILFLIAFIMMFFIGNIIFNLTADDNELETKIWFLRVIVSLCASAISVIIPGAVNIGKQGTFKTLAEEKPAITASGAIAVFVLVYLFNPLM
ncbi:hypothetical protein [Polaribacter sp. Hel1_85]|uniref:hypothetical protein n=1 Tax=Polaribacter sp. Hel1_85 TaxID=1250005 RepID=UPI00052C1811|nr:hypothetical protein [Polaribacter sp. Hel1_85]KGL63268.1 hypothetical protein PHEL85_0302 [Polaribacter sp. Hel1_85]